MVFGRALSPVNCSFEVKIGDGEVIAELKYAPPSKERDLASLYTAYQRITTVFGPRRS